MENVIIIGSGCAGLTAAIYTARASLNPLVITGNEFGGQIATTTEVENYPGFPTGLQGPELTEGMKQQAERFGTRLEYDEVIEVDLSRKPIVVKTHNATYETKTLIVASGASPRKLNVPGEKELTGRGVSYCATCDGFFFKNKAIMVVGGGDSALQESLFLAKFGSRVTIVHRRDQLRAGPALIERVSKNEKMNFVYNTVVTGITGNGAVKAVTLQDTVTGAQREANVDGLFVYVGHLPNTALYEGQLAMDHEGYLIVDPYLHTNVPGVFAAGEVHDKHFRQAIVSAGYGCMAAMEAEKYISSLE
ncbi:MAG TPA: thioredoxin-disulfide reductase [Anaerolineae bacterium]|nr:thioredoxin-disulfide reductase [Anaerolineae bacterium]